MNKFLFAILFYCYWYCCYGPGVQPATGSPLSKSIPADSLSYLNPKDYIIGGITVSGTKYLDKDVLITISKLNKGDKINLPGEQSPSVIKNLYEQGFLMMCN